MANDVELVEPEKAPRDYGFLCVCLLSLLGGLGYLMYRVAVEPRQLAGDLSEHHVAPPGTYFAREYVATTTSKGVIGLPPGTAVFVRQKGNDQWVVNDGIDDIPLKYSSLTMDVDLAERLRAQDNEAQARAAAMRARAEQLFREAEMKKRALSQMEMDEARHRMTGQPVGGGTRLDEPVQPSGGAVAYGGNGVYAPPPPPSYYNYQTQQWIKAGGR